MKRKTKKAKPNRPSKEIRHHKNGNGNGSDPIINKPMSEAQKASNGSKEMGISSLSLSRSSHSPQIFPSEVVDSLRYLLTRLERGNSTPDRLAIVSASRQEGTSYICHALGSVMAHDLDITVMVVELNWLWPSTQSQSGGLAAVLKKEAELKDAIIPTDQPNLFLLPAGRLSKAEGPSMARSQRLIEIISELSSRYDRLILDIPAILSTSDAIPLASLGDACCIVIRQGATQVSDVRNALDEIDHLPILGVIMNQVSVKTPNLIMRFIPQK